MLAVVVKLATPALTLPVPNTVVPSLKLTVPLAEAFTVAVRVTAVP